MYTRYSPGEDLSGFDFIIVGSGIGGHTTAIFLSKAGKKVLALENHLRPDRPTSEATPEMRAKN
jgi:all-trans-retinol 13,14-reductase